jgi:hypothetical protein
MGRSMEVVEDKEKEDNKITKENVKDEEIKIIK